MAYRNYDNDPYIDPRSPRETRSDIVEALVSVAAITAFIAARKKVALTRGLSKNILRAGMAGDDRYLKYLSASSSKIVTKRSLPSIREAVIDEAHSSVSSIADFVTDVFRPIPTNTEQYSIAVNYFDKFLKYPKTAFPKAGELGIRDEGGVWGKIEQLLYGPKVVPFSPGTTIGVQGIMGVPEKVGKHGALLVGDKLHFLRAPEEAKRLGSISNFYISGMHAGVVNALGGRLERERRGIIREPLVRTPEEYVRKVELDPRSVYELEERYAIKSWLGKFAPGAGLKPGMTSQELRDLARKTYTDLEETGNVYTHLRRSASAGELSRVPTIDQWFQEKVIDWEATAHTKGTFTYKRKVAKEAAETRKLIAKQTTTSMAAEEFSAAVAENGEAGALKLRATREAARKRAELRYNFYKLQGMAGAGPRYASYGEGVVQGKLREVKEKLEIGYKHPVTGEHLPIHPDRFTIRQRSLGSQWGGQEGEWFLGARKDIPKRWAITSVAGSLHKVPERAFGIGVTSRPNIATEAVRNFVGAAPGSYFDMFSRNAFKTGRMVGLGVGAFYTYQFINYLSRQTVGWGPTDIAAEGYVKAREFQQHVLKNLGIVNIARTMENAYPGTVKSPASHLLRLLAIPAGFHIGSIKGGARGAAAGLGLGIATAMITWGDLTQSPEELHRIFSGEQDIPVRKGRYWMLGKTPFFGGKISYWRKHWAPLLRSRYQYKGGLWDSETEYWAQGTPFSPVLAPLLTGQMWDPYYWEKKHYRDRPYPVTGELFEPTMPFAWLGNMTIGRVIKPPQFMHQEYLGASQGEGTSRERYMPPGAAGGLGMASMPGMGIASGESPYGASYQAGMAAYTMSEQAGLVGFAFNTIYEKLTGQHDFTATQTVLQSARRATGYERNYWDREIGDPGAGFDEGLTEYFRRFLPHKRTGVDEYNPIPNTMPEWMPGSDYFINFRAGDPYVKIPYGEARLPGRSYEALNQLHSGIPGVYDAVDRLMILANVAPYSNEFKEYKALAAGMVKGDEYWERKVGSALSQRAALNQEYEFLDTSTGNVPLLLKPSSFMYRHSLAAVTSFPNPLDMIPHKANVGALPTHINKWLPYRTPEAIYKEDRLYGTGFSSWDNPMEGYVLPYMRKLRGFADSSYVPSGVKKQREIQEYFDKLKFVKYSNLSQLARDQGNMNLASKMSKMAGRTMVGGSAAPGAAIAVMPKEERSFYEAFSGAEGEHRTRILNVVPPYMRKYYMNAWNDNDGVASYDVDSEQAQDLTGYFKHHNLPSPNWTGWHPDVSLDQVKLRVVKNEAFDIHKFNLWESNERQLVRQPFTPTIDNINAPSNDMSMLQNSMVSNMERFGFSNNKVFITRTPAESDSYNLRIKMTRNSDKKHEEAMNHSLAFR